VNDAQLQLNAENEFATLSRDRPIVNMVFHGPWNWLFAKMLAEYTDSRYHVLPSVFPIEGCDIYQYWRPASTRAIRELSVLPAEHPFHSRGIHMVHDSPNDKARANTMPRIKGIHKFAKVLCTSKEQFDFYSKYNAACEYVPLGSFPEFYTVKSKVNTSEKLRIGFTARLYPDQVKGEATLIEVAALLDVRKFEFVILSPNASMVERALRLKGFTVHSQATASFIDAFNKIDVQLILSKHEGTPLPLIESMARGNTVLSTRVGEAPVLLSAGCLARTPGEFCRVLNAIERDRSILERYRRENPAKVANRTIQTFIDSNVKMWDELCPISHNQTSTRVFIIGGGPSVNDVDLSIIKDSPVIVVNKAIDLVDMPDHFITMDYSFFSKIDVSPAEIAKRATRCHFVVNADADSLVLNDGVYTDTRHNLKYEGLENYEIISAAGSDSFKLDGFSHGENSGFCAVQYAIRQGFRDIVLIGFDLQTKGAKTHFHSAYRNNAKKVKADLARYAESFGAALTRLKSEAPHITIRTLTPSALEKYVEKIEVHDLKPKLMIVGYYTKDARYTAHADRLKASLDSLNLEYDVIGISPLGDWQTNTRYKAKFMLEMLTKHVGRNLLYVDCDAIVHSKPTLFDDYDCDIAVRWQDFEWRKNECLSGTIFMANNDRTRELCRRWQKANTAEGQHPTSFEQWNLGQVIQSMRDAGELIDRNLPPEYTMIFDSMREMYPDVKPVIEHLQASREVRAEVRRPKSNIRRRPARYK